MKVPVFLLLLLLPLCSAQKFYIECYGQDFLLVNNDVLKCSADVEQACYTRATGDKGCTRLENCSRDGWVCCRSNLCNI
uniref:uncharacterized protein wu:fj16a03 n=1 Tax=Solea senegalensis TaxID=28829 RepID=UPI001CD83A72|nr:uncharacterized protein wu:fj16a03 [Solea senegalensis]